MSKSIVLQQQTSVQNQHVDRHWLHLFYGYFKKDPQKSAYQLFQHAHILWPVYCPQTICYIYRILAERNFIHLCTLCKSLDIRFIPSCCVQPPNQSITNVLELLQQVTLNQKQQFLSRFPSKFRIESLSLFSEMKNLAVPILSEEKIVSILLQTPLRKFQNFSSYTNILQFLPLCSHMECIEFLPNENCCLSQCKFNIGDNCKRIHLQQIRNLVFEIAKECIVEELILEQCHIFDFCVVIKQCKFLKRIVLFQCQFATDSLEELQKILIHNFEFLKEIHIDSCNFQPCKTEYCNCSWSITEQKNRQMESIFIMNNCTTNNNQLIMTNFAVHYLKLVKHWTELKNFTYSLSNLVPTKLEPCLQQKQLILVANLIQQMLLENIEIRVIWLDQISAASMPDFCCKIIPFCKYFAAFDVKRNRIFLQKEPIL